MFSKPIPASTGGSSSIPIFTDLGDWFSHSENLRAQFADKDLFHLIDDANTEPVVPQLPAHVLATRAKIANNEHVYEIGPVPADGTQQQWVAVPVKYSSDQERAIGVHRKDMIKFNSDLAKAFHLVKESLDHFIWTTLSTAPEGYTVPPFTHDKLQALMGKLVEEYGSATPARVMANLAKINALPLFENHLVAEKSLVEFQKFTRERTSWGDEYKITDSQNLIWLQLKLDTEAFRPVLHYLDRLHPKLTFIQSLPYVITHIKIIKDRIIMSPPKMLTSVSPPDSFPQVLAAGNVSSVRQCYICGSPDHMQRDCPQFKKSVNYMKTGLQKRFERARPYTTRNGDKFARPPMQPVPKDTKGICKRFSPRDQANAATMAPNPGMDQQDEDQQEEDAPEVTYFANSASASSSSSSSDFFDMFEDIAYGDSA